MTDRELIVAHAPFSAVIFDFNGTLSDDEVLLCRLFQDIFSRRLGYQLSEERYLALLSGLSDAEIVETVLSWVGRGGDSRVRDELHSEKVSRYRREVALRPRISGETVAVVRRIAQSVPVAVVTGAVHAEVDTALEACGILDLFRAVVAGDDTAMGKPDPEGFLRASEVLVPATPSQILVFEDSWVGVQAAKAAGMMCVKVGDVQSQSKEGLSSDCIVDGLFESSLSWIYPLLGCNGDVAVHR
ncbi:HAD family hydrolase [Ferrimicrobium acidiphilum]|uniref:HAD family hydrolase n=1 Tax=Ferrimicrobium acidiphilum TaxID=121039 RepID=UPI0023F09471|nr:HAD family phosphatase [Ferrimicrobium acidiphilum]